MNMIRAFPWRCVVVVAAGALSLQSCAIDKKTGAQTFAGIKVSDDPCAKTATVAGAAIGAIAGAIIANQVDHKTKSDKTKNKVIGVSAGAAIGGLIGHDIDRRRCELYKISKKYNVDIDISEVAVPAGQLRTPGREDDLGSSGTSQSRVDQRNGTKAGNTPSGLSVNVRDTGHQFFPGSDQLSSDARAYFNEVAAQYSYVKQAKTFSASSTKEDRDAVESLRSKRILLIGHTDDIGNSRSNADLSERRAMAVAKVFRDQGISDSQLFYQGAGETLPIADNHTEEGRSRNRRVEIVDVTDNTSFRKFLAMRKPQIEYYRPASPAVLATPTRAPSTQSESTVKSPPVRADEVVVETVKKSVGPSPSPRPSDSSASTYGPIDFGGAPASSLNAAADFGNEIRPKPGFSLISTAQATDGPIVPSCSTDRPRVSNGVKSLRDQKNISITEYMPGLYNTSWMDTVNGNLVGLSNVAVYRDGGSPANSPSLYIFRDYKKGSRAKPNFAARPEVNVYRGDKALLYRVFVNGPVKCMDVLFPYENSGAAIDSHLFYDRQGTLYVAQYKPNLAR
jgi:outer membrane protein OmpA-like peptidoglycan-associated protein